MPGTWPSFQLVGPVSQFVVPFDDRGRFQQAINIGGSVTKLFVSSAVNQIAEHIFVDVFDWSQVLNGSDTARYRRRSARLMPPRRQPTGCRNITRHLWQFTKAAFLEMSRPRR